MDTQECCRIITGVKQTAVSRCFVIIAGDEVLTQEEAAPAAVKQIFQQEGKKVSLEFTMVAEARGV